MANVTVTFKKATFCPAGVPRAVGEAASIDSALLSSMDRETFTPAIDPTPALGDSAEIARENASATTAAAAAVAEAPKGNVWQRKGRIIRDPTALAVNQEPNVLYEANSLLLGLSASEPVFKLWYSGGNTGTTVGAGGSGGMYYAESRNGIENWVQRATPVIEVASRCSVVKDGANYYIYHLPGGHRYSSTDGVTFSAPEVLSITGTSGAWEAGGRQNSYTWKEGATWYMTYDAAGATGNIWQAGLATSSDGVNWVLCAQNPILRAEDGLLSVSSLDVHKVGDTYWGWFHGTAANSHLATTTIPTEIYRAKSTDLINWERSPMYPVFSRATPDEGVASEQGQTADAALIEVGGRVFMFYEGADGSVMSLRNSSIKVAVANMSFAELTTTVEGESPGEVVTRDAMGGRYISESVSIGAVAGLYYEKVALKTNPTDARAISVSHAGAGAAITVTGLYPCPALLDLGGGANYQVPILLHAGAVLTTPVAGAIEFDGTNLYFTTAAGVRKTITAT